MNCKEVYKLIKETGVKKFGVAIDDKGFQIAKYSDIEWDVSLLEERIVQEDILDFNLEEDCIIDSWETWYLINSRTKEVELFTECSKPVIYFEERVMNNPDLELYSYVAEDYMITKLVI